MALLAVLGAVTILGQVVLLRELTVAFYGAELVILLGVALWLAGTGQATVGIRSAEPVTEHSITVYQHYVATPVPIGAATSPASILSPLRVTVD